MKKFLISGLFITDFTVVCIVDSYNKKFIISGFLIADFTLVCIYDKYSSNLLTPTWPLCKNILSVDYERSISFRKCNRWKSFDIMHVCLNKKCYNIQYDYDVGQWRLGRTVSEHCLRSESRGFDPHHISFSIFILV